MTTASLAQYPNVDDWIVIGTDGRVRVRTGKVDIGQRISTALALIAAEELDVDLAHIDVDEVDTASSLDEEYTSASNSMERCGNSHMLRSSYMAWTCVSIPVRMARGMLFASSPYPAR